MKKLSVFFKSCILLAMLLVAADSSAQYLRTSYFMEGATNRSQLNPALRPTKGYINIPAAGALYASVNSNTFGVKDIYEIIDDDNKILQNETLFSKLQTNNRMNVNLNTDILSFGFYSKSGKGFWTVNLGLRTNINGNIPKDMLEYARYIDNMDLDHFMEQNKVKTFDVRDMSLAADVYTEVGIGYSREINDRFTLGVKGKLLLGVGNVDMKVNRMYLEEGWVSQTEYKAKIETDAQLDVSMEGLILEEERDEKYDRDYISKLDYDKFGFSGYGLGVDLGATYKVLDNLTLSAALLDWGFISWSKGSNQTAISKTSREYNASIAGGEVIDLDVLGYELTDETKSRSSSLTSTFVAGAEYGLFNNKLGIGLLSTTYFAEPRTISELTLSANYRPSNLFNAAVSYSVLQSAMKTFGLAVKLGPLFVGTDYMFFGNDSDSKSVNAYVGISIPLGGKPYKASIDYY